MPCLQCQGPILRKVYAYRAAKYCSTGCYHFSRRHKERPCVDKRGYRRQQTKTGRQYEHILIAEKALGRSLTQNETVHHINGNRQDNRNANLLICTRAYHAALHARMAYLYQQAHFGG